MSANDQIETNMALTPHEPAHTGLADAYASGSSIVQAAYPTSVSSGQTASASLARFPVGDIPTGALPARANIDSLVRGNAEPGVGPAGSAISEQFRNPHEAVLQRLKEREGVTDKDNLSNGILDGFRAGTNVMNTLPNSVGIYADGNPTALGSGPQQYRAHQGNSISDQFSLTRGNDSDQLSRLPANPRQGYKQITGPGKPQYGIQMPNEEKLSDSILAAYQNIREDGQLAGFKAELLPTFEGDNTINLPVAPIFETTPKDAHKGRGGLPMPDHLRIDIRDALRQGHDIPTGYIENDMQLAEALEVMGYEPGDGGLSRAGPYGAIEAKNNMMAESNATVPDNFYQGTEAGIPTMYVPNPKLLM